MATMYSLFFGFLLAAVCSDSGSGDSDVRNDTVTPSSVISTVVERSKNFIGLNYNRFLFSFEPGEAHLYSLMNKDANKSRLGQYYAKYFLTALNISEPLRFATLHRSVFKDPQKVFLTRYSSRPFYRDSANSSIRTMLKNVAFDIFKNLKEEAQSIVLKISSDEAWTLDRYQVSRPFGMEDKRNLIINIASAELGVKEATGNNDGARVEEYLRYTHLGKGYDWCAAFVSWCYGQAGLSQPRNPWSPALFPKARSHKETDRIEPADLFAIYSAKLKRIHHVGLIQEKAGAYILTIEGNSNDRVESRRRHVNTVYRYADWVN